MTTLALLSPYRLGPLALPNRVVMAPLTRNRSPGTVPGEVVARYYRQRASAGLIVSEGSQISPQGRGYVDTPGVHEDAQVAGWRGVTSAVHEAGGRIVLQLWHVGLRSHPSFLGGAPPVSASSLLPEGEVRAADGSRAPYAASRALDEGEIPAVVEQYRRAASLAREAGFDGVEIHGANGYLITQFLHTTTNRRRDGYGGTPERRARFALEVVEAVASVWGAERVGLRLSPATPFDGATDADADATYGALLGGLADAGLAYLHVVRAPLPDGGDSVALLRRLWRGTLIAAGGYDRDAGERALRAGEADLIAYGRLFIANPDLPERFARGAPLTEPDRDTFYRGGERGYTDYPTLAGAPDR